MEARIKDLEGALRDALNAAAYLASGGSVGAVSSVLRAAAAVLEQPTVDPSPVGGGMPADDERAQIWEQRQCPDCKGVGYIRVAAGVTLTGKVVGEMDDTCWACDGKGTR